MSKGLAVSFVVIAIPVAIAAFLFFSRDVCDPDGYQRISWRDVTFEIPECWEVREHEEEEFFAKAVTSEEHAELYHQISVKTFDIPENLPWARERFDAVESFTFGENTFVQTDVEHNAIIYYYPLEEEYTYYWVNFHLLLPEEEIDYILSSFEQEVP